MSSSTASTADLPGHARPASACGSPPAPVERAGRRVVARATWPAATAPLELPPAPRVLLHQARFHLGDTLWLTPLLRRLVELRPAVRVTVVGPPVASTLLPGLAGVETVVPYRPSDGAPGRQRVQKALKATAFDTALSAFARRPETAWLGDFSAERRIPTRINLEYFDPQLDERRPPLWATHEGWCEWGAEPSPAMLLRLLEPFGVESDSTDLRPEHALPAPKDDPLRHHGLEAGAYVVLAPGGRSSRRWPAARFAELARRLVEAGWRVLVEGAPDEASLLEQVRSRAGSGPAIVAATDGLPELAVLLRHAALLVSNDSGAVHLAAAEATPTLYIAEAAKLRHSYPGNPRAVALFDDRDDDLGNLTVGDALAALTTLQVGHRVGSSLRPTPPVV